MTDRTLVTGGTGLLGTALRGVLPDAVYVGGKECDLTEPKQVEELLGDHKPRRIVHLAARVAGVKENAERNAELFAENVKINTLVVDAARRRGVKRLVALLSACAFEFEDGRASVPSDLHRGLPFAGNLGYAYAKRALDVQLRVAHAQDGLAYGSITPATLYGPHDHFGSDSAHVIAALLTKALDAKAAGSALEVWGTGRAVRQFVFVEDVARVIAEILDKDAGPETLIVAPDDGVSIGELAREIAAAAGFTGPIRFDPSKPEGAARRVLSRDRFNQLFPDFRFTSLKDGLDRTRGWLEARRHASTRR